MDQEDLPYGSFGGPITPYASKYGVVNYEELPLLAGSNSSGIAPRLKTPMTKMEYFLEMALERCQRDQLSGFTTQELVDLDAHERQGVKPSDLCGPIHPLFDRQTQWVSTLVPHNIGIDGFGVWDVKNEYLWRAMRPCLILATRFIENSFIHPWFMAILFGPLKVIPNHRFGNNVNDGFPHYFASFHNVTQDIPIERVIEKWHELRNHIKFALGVQMHENLRGVTRVRGATNSNYLPPTKHVIGRQDSRIEINILLFKPLLYAISAAERLIMQFTTAKTIVHELCHALGRYRVVDIPINPEFPNVEHRKAERLFYEDEIYLELGYSFENAIYGGVIETILPRPNYGHHPQRPELSFPLVSAILTSWPTFDRVYTNQGRDAEPTFIKEVKIPLLQTPKFTPWTFSAAHYPISVSFMEDIQQEEYWQNCVSKWGADMSKPFPRMFGIRTFRDPSNPQDSQLGVYRHFGGKLSVEDAKFQFPHNRMDAQMRALCIRRFRVVMQVCMRLRTRRDERRNVSKLYGPMGYWDPDSELGDTIPELDDEAQLRDAIAEALAQALGTENAKLDPHLSTEFLMRYFLSPVVPRESPVDIGSLILDLNSKEKCRFDEKAFLALSGRIMEQYVRDEMDVRGYPPDYPLPVDESFHSVRRARKLFQEQQQEEAMLKAMGSSSDEEAGS